MPDRCADTLEPSLTGSVGRSRGHGGDGRCPRRTRSSKEEGQSTFCTTPLEGRTHNAKGTLTLFFARHPWALDRRHPWRLTVRRRQHPSPPRARVHPFAGTNRGDRCSRRSHRIARKFHRMHDATMRSVDSRGGGSVRRTVRRHGWRRSSAQGWLERVRCTDPASRLAATNQRQCRVTFAAFGPCSAFRMRRVGPSR
jgi:hypothetical protein